MALVPRNKTDAIDRTKDQALTRLGCEIEERDRSLAQLQAAVAKRDAEIDSIESEIKELESVNEANTLMITRVEREQGISAIAPEDAYDTIVRKENTLKLEERRCATLRKEVHDLPLVILAKDKELEAANKELQYVTEVTGWCPTRKPMDQVAFDRAMQDITEMELLIRRLEEERKTTTLIVRKKEQLIDTLQNELNRKKEVSETLLLTNNTIRVTDRDVREIQESIDGRKKEHNKADMALVAVEDSRDMVALQSLQEDVTFLQSELQKHQQSGKDQACLIKKQQFRIEQLEGRLAVITAAANDLGLEKDVQVALRTAVAPLTTLSAQDITSETVLPSDEMIDVELYELVHRDLSDLRNASSMKNILTLEKGGTLEALERKLEIMLASKRMEAQVYEQEKMEQEARIVGLRHELEAHQEHWLEQLQGPTRRRLQMQREISKALSPPPHRK